MKRCDASDRFRTGSKSNSAVKIFNTLPHPQRNQAPKVISEPVLVSANLLKLSGVTSMSTGYDIDAINRMLGLDNDSDAATAVLPDRDDHNTAQSQIEPWLSDEQSIRVTSLQRVISTSPDTLVPPSSPVRLTQITQPGQTTTLLQASNQWATRPADERFWTIEDMAAQCNAWKEASREERVDLGKVSIVNESGRMLVTGGGMQGPGEFSHYSFGQLCRVAGAPGDYLRGLDGDLAAQCLTSGLRKKNRDDLASAGNVLVRSEGEGHQRVGAFLSSGYSRIWNADVIGRLGQLGHDGWRIPPARPASVDDPRARPATESDLLASGKGGSGIQLSVGDLIAPAGLYASDKDCFAFMVKETSIEVGGGVMNRGFFVSNSEVGDRAFTLTSFLYDSICSNHIVWGASEVSEVRIVHRGRANNRWIGDLHRALVVYAGKSSDVERKMILNAMSAEIAFSKEDVIEKLFKDKRINVTKRNLELAYDWSVREARLRGNVFKPNTVWGMVCGLTRVSQECGWADERVAIDCAAGKLLAMAS